MENERIELGDGAWLELAHDFIAPERASALAGELADALAWRVEWLTIAGRKVAQPRLTAWYGDRGARYAYSGLTLEPAPLPHALAALRAEVVVAAGGAFNSVLCNLYRDENDSVGWHADAERELGPDPLIASLSFGCARRFELCHKRERTRKHALVLGAGDLLVMAGTTQRHFRHRVPKERAACGPRVNLTFRRVLAA